MAKKIKLLNATHSSELEVAINSYIENGWTFKGEIVSHNFTLVATLYNKRKMK